MKMNDNFDTKIYNFINSYGFIQKYEYDEKRVLVYLGNDEIVDIPFSREVLNIIKDIYENQDVLVNSHFPFLKEEIKKTQNSLDVSRLICLVILLCSMIFLMFNLFPVALVVGSFLIPFIHNNLTIKKELKKLKTNEKESFQNLRIFDDNDIKLQRAINEIYEKQKETVENSISIGKCLSKDIKVLDGGKIKVISHLENNI